MKRILLSCIMLLMFGASSALFAQSSIKSGPIVGGSIGWQNKDHIKGFEYLYDKNPPYFGMSFGYQFRIKTSNLFFFDIAPQYGFQYMSLTSPIIKPDFDHASASTAKAMHELSVPVTYNISLWGKLNIGVGVAPNVYFGLKNEAQDMGIQLSSNNTMFDVPVYTKIGYDFGKVEVALSYKNGFVPIFKNEYLKNRAREAQVSVFVPLFGK